MTENRYDFCVFPEIIKLAFADYDDIRECFDRNVETDLIARLEAVGDGLRRTIQSHGHSVDLVGLHARRESCIGESHYPKSGRINTRSSGFSIKRDPNFGRILSPDFMETKCRERQIIPRGTFLATSASEKFTEMVAFGSM